MGDDNIDQFKIGLNKPVEEYLELINEQNKQKKAKQSRINKGKELIKGKEEGFNVYLSGANQQRLKNINKKYKKSGKDSSEAVLRKEWTEHPDNAPSFGIAQKSGFPQAIQYNPFSPQQEPSQNIPIPPQPNPKHRKKWDQEEEGGEVEVEEVKSENEEIEETIFSDSFEETNVKEYEKGDSPRPQPKKQSQENSSLKDFLSNVGKKEMDILRESLSHARGLMVLNQLKESGDLKGDTGDEADKELEDEDEVNIETGEYIEKEEDNKEMRVDKGKGKSESDSIEEDILERNSGGSDDEFAQLARMSQEIKELTSYPVSKKGEMKGGKFLCSPPVMKNKPKVRNRKMKTYDELSGGIKGIAPTAENISSKTNYSRFPNSISKKQKLNINPFKRPFSHEVGHRKEMENKSESSKVMMEGAEEEGNTVNSVIGTSTTARRIVTGRDNIIERRIDSNRRGDIEEDIIEEGKQELAAPESEKIERGEEGMVEIEDYLARTLKNIEDPVHKEGVQIAFKRIKKLRVEQISKLLLVLDKIEKGELESGALDVDLFTPQQTNKKPKLPRPTLTSVNLSKPNINNINNINENKYKKEILLRILSTWGHAQQAGLTEVQIYNSKGMKIHVPTAAVQSRNIGQGPRVPLSRITNNEVFTKNDRSMWVAPMPAHPHCLEILIYLDHDIQLGGILLYNYNKSILDSVKGVKQMHILVDRKLLWNGIINRAPGRSDIEYVTEVRFIEEFVFINRPKLRTNISNIQPKHKKSRLPGHKGSNITTPRNELEIPKELQKVKSAMEIGKRPVSVPIWLQDESISESVVSNESSSTKTNQSVTTAVSSITPSLSKKYEEKRGSNPPTQQILQKYRSAQSLRSQRALSSREEVKSKFGGGVPECGIIGGNMIIGEGNKYGHHLEEVPKRQGSKTEGNSEVGTMKNISMGIYNRDKPEVRKEDPLKEIKPKRRKLGEVEDQVNPTSTTIGTTSTTGYKRNYSVPKDRGIGGQKTSNYQGMEIVGGSIGQESTPRVHQKPLRPGMDAKKPVKAFARSALKKASDGANQSHSFTEGGALIDLGVGSGGALIDLGVGSGSGTDNTNGAHINNTNNTNNRSTNTRTNENPLPQLHPSKNKSQINKSLQVKNKVPPALPLRGEKATEEKLPIDGKQKMDLESLELFKITNLGRIAAADRKPQTRKDEIIFEELVLPTPNEDRKKDVIAIAINSRSREGNIEVVEGGGREVVEAEKSKSMLPELEQERKEMAGDALDNLISNYEKRPISLDQRVKLAGENADPRANAATQQKPLIANPLSPLEEHLSDRELEIPSLPSGRVLKFEMLTTWGDQHYLGLSGIEAFDMFGRPINLSKYKIHASPSDINTLPGFGSDPRTIDKLFDGIYFTRDDLHVWLCPYTHGRRHTITIDMRISNTFSMIRIWNYNKNRIHACRGAKDIAIYLDDKPVFRGPIRKSSGLLTDPITCSELILFTENTRIIQEIVKHDWIDLIDPGAIQGIIGDLEERPPTASKEDHQSEGVIDQYERPYTSAIVRPDPQIQLTVKEKLAQQDKELALLDAKANEKHAAQTKATKSKHYIKGKVVEVNILETWGDPFYVGLSGIEILSREKENLAIKNVDANPRDMNVIPGYSGDYRTLDKLIDGVNTTTDDRHMWLIPFTQGQSHNIKLEIECGEEGREIGGLRIYNYNKSGEDSSRGARTISISIDGKLATSRKGITTRRAMGNNHYDFGHYIPLPYKERWSDEEIGAVKRSQAPVHLMYPQEYEPFTFPMGYTYEFSFISTHGDSHYMGLNGLQLYDQLGEHILHSLHPKTPFHLHAFPSSVTELPGMERDIRTLAKLLDGYNDTLDDRHMWLTPFRNTKIFAQSNRHISNTPNKLYLTFDNPLAISALKIWNYSKTPTRGIFEFELKCDHKLIFRGYLKKYQGNGRSDDGITTIIFSSESKKVEQFRKYLNFHPNKEQDVLMINDKQTMNPNRAAIYEDMTLQRPMTSVIGV